MGVSFVPDATNKESYLFSISTSQDVAAHNVDEVGLGIQLTHQPAEPPPEPGHTGEVRTISIT